MEVDTLAHSVFLQNRTQFESSESKGVLRVIRKNAGLPKGRNLYGNGVIIVPDRNNYLNFVYGRPNSLRKGSVTFNLISFKNSYSTGSTNLLYEGNNVRLKLQSLSNRMSKFPNKVVDRNLIQILCKPEFLKMVYGAYARKININLDSCNLTPELKSDIISGHLFKTISDDIKSESFHFYRSDPHPSHRMGPGVIWKPANISNSKASMRKHLTNKLLTKELLKNKIVLEAVKLFLVIVFYSPPV